MADLQTAYSGNSLDLSKLASDPIDQFNTWFEAALQFSERALPNAMTLATANAKGVPSARIVLLKDVDGQGFIFFTNYKSRKGREIMENPHGALVFWWPALERQVRVQGTLKRISPEKSDRYFASRPRGSQFGAWASEQSSVISGREELIDRMERLEEKYRNKEVPRPPHWGGFRLRPFEIEFWQGGANRLHDRVRYQKNDTGTWKMERLAP